MNKEDKIRIFDPNSPGDTSMGIFGLPFSEDESEVVIIPVPWEVTVSYGGGTAKGPKAVFDASFQVDLHDSLFPELWKIGIAMNEIPVKLARRSALLRKKSEHYITKLEQGQEPDTNKAMRKLRDEINKACEEMNAHVKHAVSKQLKTGKLVALLGGDHSTPLGMMQALGEHVGSFSILQIDAHADLRKAYEGFTYSHASIMYNALRVNGVEKLVQVGIRDHCPEESDEMRLHQGKVMTFFDRDLKHGAYKGLSWEKQCDEIIATLSDKVYLSFDIDGLDPKLCPNTGTPVAGGLEFEQACFLIEKLVRSGKKLIAFDINEVSPGKDEWDANVGARLLYRFCGYLACSNGKISMK